MLADAIRAEGYRLSKNRGALFWSVLFVPVMALLIGVVSDVIINQTQQAVAARGAIDLTMAAAPLNMGQALIDIVRDLANPVVAFFVLIGATTVWAGDYRWETWRLISARNSRTNLMVAKLAMVAALCLAAMVALTVFNGLHALIRAMITGRDLTFEMNGAQALDVLLMWMLGWLRLIQIAVLGLLTAVLTRSLLAALFVPLVVLIGHGIVPMFLMGLGQMPDSWLVQLLSPDAAYNALRGLIIQPTSAATPTNPQMWIKAVLGLALWTGLPIAGALAWFQRQDLSKE